MVEFDYPIGIEYKFTWLAGICQPLVRYVISEIVLHNTPRSYRN